MVRRVYIIPIGGSQDIGLLNAERMRVGNIFDTDRQGVMLTKNTEGGISRSIIFQNIDTFDKLDTASYERNSMGTNGINMSYVAKTATYTATATDYCIDCTSGTFTVNLPTASGIAGRVYVIKNSGAGVITIDGSGAETIDGQLTQSIDYPNAIMVMSNGTNWIII